MCEECAPYVPVVRLVGSSGFRDYFGCVYDTHSDNIQKVISLGSGLMCNAAAVCGGKIVVIDLSEKWKSLDVLGV